MDGERLERPGEGCEWARAGVATGRELGSCDPGRLGVGSLSWA